MFSDPAGPVEDNGTKAYSKCSSLERDSGCAGLFQQLDDTAADSVSSPDYNPLQSQAQRGDFSQAVVENKISR